MNRHKRLLEKLQLPAVRLAMADLGAWLALGQSTAVGGEYITIIDALGGPSTAQTDTDRRPAAATAANGIPVATWDGTDVLQYDLSANNAATAKWGCAQWLKPAQFGAQQRLYSAVGAALSGGANVSRLRHSLLITSGFPTLDVFVSGLNGRTYTAASVGLTAATWNHLRWQFDPSLGGAEFDDDGTKTTAMVRCFIGGTAIALAGSNIGSGGTVSALLAATGFATLGAANDSDTPVNPILNGGQTGDLLVYSRTPSAINAAILAELTRPT